MDRLIRLEPSNLVALPVEPGRRCTGELTLRNVMYTMPVAFRLQPADSTRYTVRPQSGIISPLCTLTVEITYHPQLGRLVPDSFPYSNDSFQLHSVVVPGAAVKNPSSTIDSVPNDWFTTRKKQVFVDSGVRILFVGSVVLVKLVADGSMDRVREVLERSDPEWNSVDSVDESTGQSLLHIAINSGRADLVQLLLEFSPEVEMKDGSGQSPLETAAAAGESLIVELLLARGATARGSSSSMGPLHLAARGGHLDVMRLLLLAGAEVNDAAADGRTALHFAAEARRRDCARLLISDGADVNAVHAGGGTPLHAAAANGDEATVKLLLKSGANKDVRNAAGKTAYDAAAESGHVRLFDWLRLGDRLCAAARRGDASEVRRLLDGGAAVNGRDQNGWSALHRACFKGRSEVARVLLEEGVDVNGEDDDGYTALHCAVEAGHGDVVELLVKKGADVNARTGKGVAAVEIADAIHYTGIARTLVCGGAARVGESSPPEKGVVGKEEVRKVNGRVRRSRFGRPAMAMAL